MMITCFHFVNKQTKKRNAAYNGYHHHACINFPGSWHDSMVCQSLVDVVMRKIDVYALCVDQGFPMTGDLMDSFVGPLSKKLKGRNESV